MRRTVISATLSAIILTSPLLASHRSETANVDLLPAWLSRIVTALTSPLRESELRPSPGPAPLPMGPEIVVGGEPAPETGSGDDQPRPALVVDG